ncbi:hypothetical protein AR685_01390 [Chryseobacterium sp. JAH]|nr:hypothetical protein AR685_01390 [Chryseobacterium sp. JAH]
MRNEDVKHVEKYKTKLRFLVRLFKFIVVDPSSLFFVLKNAIFHLNYRLNFSLLNQKKSIENPCFNR